MTGLPGRRPVALSRLREIGWSMWDPIGIGPPKPEFADEYDSYLLKAFGLLRRGASIGSTIERLVEIERVYIGLEGRSDAGSRAAATVNALYAYVVNLDGAPPKAACES